MKSFGNKRKPRVIKVDDPDEQENGAESQSKEAESTGKYSQLSSSSLREPNSDADFCVGHSDG